MGWSISRTTTIYLSISISPSLSLYLHSTPYNQLGGEDILNLVKKNGASHINLFKIGDDVKTGTHQFPYGTYMPVSL